MEAKGLYREMLTAAWRRGARLPNDYRAIQVAIGASTDEWARCWPLVQKYWRQQGDTLVNDTQLEVYAEAIERANLTRDRASNAAHARWNKPSSSSNANAYPQAMPEHMPKHDKPGDGTLLVHAQAMPEQCPPSPSPSPSPDLSPTPSPSPVLSNNGVFRGGSAQSSSGNGAHAGRVLTPIIGRSTHIGHAACDEHLSYCVPAAVHNKLADLLSPKHGGDREKAKTALQGWYVSVWAVIPPGTVMGDAFRFWQSRFDEAFATVTPVKKKLSKLDAAMESIRRKAQA
jgi:uncharacterized protein YdaU (DUF1376 family)